MKTKYIYSINGNTVYCMTYYAGKTIKGVAKCDPEDEFDITLGKKIALTRAQQGAFEDAEYFCPSRFRKAGENWSCGRQF